MANVYVDSAAAGAGTGADWTNAYTKLATALAAKAAGDDFWVAHTHSETTGAAVNLVSPGTSPLPCRIICVNKAGSVPPVAADLATTAVVAMTGTFTMAFTGMAYCYGIEFKAGDAANVGLLRWNATGFWKHKNCKFTLNTTAPTSAMNPANSPLARTDWEDCTVRFGHISQGIAPQGGGFTWVSTTPGVSAVDTSAGGITPGNLFTTNCSGATRVRGLDLSAYAASSIVAAGVAQSYNIHFENCRHGTTTMGNKVPSPITSILLQDVVFSRVDKALNYTFEKFSYTGTETAEVTIVSTGGATDGTTPVAKKIVTTAFSKIEHPFECIPITVWNETTGSAITLTVQAFWNNAAVPTNANIWIEVEYLSNASYPISSVISSGLATVLSTSPSSYAAGTNTWGDTTSPFAMAVTFTPQMKGPITVRVKAALAGTTFYVDPKIVIT